MRCTSFERSNEAWFSMRAFDRAFNRLGLTWLNWLIDASSRNNRLTVITSLPPLSVWYPSEYASSWKILNHEQFPYTRYTQSALGIFIRQYKAMNMNGWLWCYLPRMKSVHQDLGCSLCWNNFYGECVHSQDVRTRESFVSRPTWAGFPKDIWTRRQVHASERLLFKTQILSEHNKVACQCLLTIRIIYYAIHNFTWISYVSIRPPKPSQAAEVDLLSAHFGRGQTHWTFVQRCQKLRNSKTRAQMLPLIVWPMMPLMNSSQDNTYGV